MKKCGESRIPNWWLDDVAELDLIATGLAGSLLRSSNHRKQTIAAILSLVNCRVRAVAGEHFAFTIDKKFAENLPSGRLHSLVEQAFGSCPDGFLPALKRMGGAISPPAIYVGMHRIFADPKCRIAVRAIQQASVYRDELFDIAVGSPDWLLRSGILCSLRSQQERDDLISAVEIFRKVCPDADEPAIIHSLRQAARTGDLGTFVQSWFYRAKLPTLPYQFGHQICHVGTGVELRRFARDFQNCAESFRMEILAGTEAFYRCQTPAGEFAGQLSRNSEVDPWIFTGTHAPRNERPPSEARHWIEDQFREAGVVIPKMRNSQPVSLQGLDRLLDYRSSRFFDWEADLVD